MVNVSDRVLVTEEFGGLNVPPRGEVEIADGYCDARLAMNGDRVPSLVERLAKVLVPVDPKMRENWGKHLRLTALPTAPVVEQLRAEGMPPAVSAMVERGVINGPARKRRGN